MKILQLGKFYPIRGGVEKVMWDITAGLSRKNIPCDMLCAVLPDRQIDWKDAPYQQTRDGMLAFCLGGANTVYCAPARKKVAGTMLSPAMISVLRRICKDYDIIHVHHPDPMACLALRLSGYKGKVVLHWHSDIVSQKGLLRLYKPLQRWLIKRADVIVGTTPVYLEESPFLRHVPKEKKRVVPIGIDPVPHNEAEVKQVLEKYKGRKIIFTLGRIVPYKGYDYLIEAARFLPDDYLVLIGGSGPQFAHMQQMVYNLCISNKVEMLGYLSDEKAHALFHACQVFVLPSVMKTEAFGIVQIEAMSCGKPLVATQIPGSGVSWVNQDGVSGLNVPCRNAWALSQAIRDICEDPALYERYSSGSRQRYNHVFTSQLMIDQCLNIYENLLQA